MAYNLKQQVEKPERLAGGHRLCAGCGAAIAVRGVLRALKPEDKAVITNATSCLEVSSFLYPYTAWTDSYIHSAFENAGATAGGVEAAYRVLKRKGKIDETYKFIAFGGDGGTYDIGLQSLSGAMERGHDMVYVCYDNEAYMNTGIQRSSSTPRFADATTTPVGSVIPGKPQNKKDLTAILAAHNIPYVAQTTFIGNFKDFHEKAEKAIYTEGPAFLNVMSPCPRGWRYEAEDLAEICKLAVDTCVWPLFEVENGVWKLNYEPKKKLPVEEYLKKQGRFKHLFEKGNEWISLLVKCK
ncbi:MAG: thiamine pyrophosphate-dependent enzyme [Bacillota bacterium]